MSDVPRSALSRGQRMLFTAIMVAIPVLFFLLLEGGLRLVDYGDSYPLVKTGTRFGKEKAFLNRQVARRYFNLPPEIVPEPSEEIFDVAPRKDAFRVVCLGGSTTAGFPFEINATFPFQLQFRLRNALLDNWVEVINVGISAVNSYTVLDLLPEILELEPDLVLIYMGHNEYYGALGVGSTQYVSGNRHLVKAYLALRKLRFFQLMENIVLGIQRLGSGDEVAGKPDPSMMRAMSAGKHIPFGSDLYEAGAENFRGNLDEIVATVKSAGVPVMVSTLVSNLRDQPPFVSRFAPGLDSSAVRRAEGLLDAAGAALAAGAADRADSLATMAVIIDSTHAGARYLRGRTLLAVGDTAAARPHFVAAREYDQLRFRAPARFNTIIREVARARDVPLVNMDAVFAGGSPGGIPGNDWFLEHLHPTFDGYRLMAQAFFEAIRIHQVARPKAPITYRETLLRERQIDEVLATFPEDSAAVTPLDIEFGLLRNFFLVNRWPFADRPVSLDDYTPYGSDLTEAIAARRFREKRFWEAAHYEAAEAYLERGDYERARREYRAVNLAFYDNYIPFMKIGDVHTLEGNHRKAYNWYTMALDADSGNVNVMAKQGRSLVLLNQFPAAVTTLSVVAERERRDPVLPEEDRATLFYMLGLSHANLREWDPAERALEDALALRPDFEAVRILQRQIGRFRSQQSPSEE